MPNGFGARGLPTSMQFMGRAWEENTILAAARAYQSPPTGTGAIPPTSEGYFESWAPSRRSRLSFDGSLRAFW